VEVKSWTRRPCGKLRPPSLSAYPLPFLPVQREETQTGEYCIRVSTVPSKVRKGEGRRG
jgi:hypothetical protein